jgi:Ser/Thr protein kinase RdoA (MazF antagonist)
VDADERSAVLAAYGVDVSVLDEYGVIPVRVRIVRDRLKIRTETGARMLKRIRVPEAQARFAFECTEHVAASRRVPRVPRWIRTRYGDPYVVDGTGIYYMTLWIPGRELDPRRPQECIAVARALGEWQQAARGAPNAASAGPWPRWLMRMEAGAEVLRRLSGSEGAAVDGVDGIDRGDGDTPFLRLARAAADSVLAAAEPALATLRSVCDADWSTMRSTGWVCHGRLARQHWWFDGDMWTLIDYDEVQPAHPVTDLGLFLHRFMPIHNWQPELVSRCIEAYESAWQGEAFPAEALAAMLAVPVRPLQAVQWYARGAQAWDENDYVDYLESALEDEAARERARRAWLAQIRRPAAVVPAANTDGCLDVENAAGDGMAIPVEMTGIEASASRGTQAQALGERDSDGVSRRKKRAPAPAERPGAPRVSPSPLAPGLRLWGDVARGPSTPADAERCSADGRLNS